MPTEPTLQEIAADKTGVLLYKDWVQAKELGLSIDEHCQLFGLEYTTYKSRIYRGKVAWNGEGRDPFQVEYSLGSVLRLRGDAVIVGDVHIPFTHHDFAMLPALWAQRYLREHPRRLIVAGDFWNFDQFSHYTQVVSPPSFEQERDFGKRLLQLWLETFDEIYFTMGNHDRRLQKYTNGAFDVTDIMALVISNPDKIKTNNYGYCVLETPAGEWRITHPANYGVNQLTVANELAQKYRQNIVSFHEHHLAHGWDKYGRQVVINGGWLGDESKLAYVKMDDNKSPEMKRGFVSIVNGVGYTWGESPYTDWSKWL